MKKVLFLSLISLLVISSAFAADGLSLFGGTSLYLSHIGASYREGQFEFGASYYTTFPNLAIISIVEQAQDHAGDPENMEPVTPAFVGSALWESLTLGGIVSVDTSVDVIPSKTFDLNLGLSGCAVIAPALFGDDPLTVLAMCATLKAGWNFNDHSGIYFGTQFPLAALSIGFDEIDGKRELDYDLCSIVPFDDDSFLLIGYVLSVYTAKIGYIHHF